MKLLILSILLLLQLSTHSQTITSSPTDTNKVCLDKADYKIILAGAYEGDCTKVELNACNIDLKNTQIKVKRKNTAITILAALVITRLTIDIFK